MSKKNSLCFSVVIAILVFVAIGSVSVHAETLKKIQSSSVENSVFAYIPRINEAVQDVKAQFGNSANAEVQLLPIAETNEASIHTTLLFDNSYSIVESNRERMKQVAKGVVSNHEAGEEFSLYTFDTELHEVIRDSNSYDEINTQIDNVAYVNQETYLKEVLYSAISNPDGKEGAYHRFIIFSDGSNDNEVGNTYNEILKILEDKNYAVCVVGSRYERKLDDLEKLFSVARESGAPYYLLDDSSDLATIATEIQQTVPDTVAKITIPDELKNGSTQRIKVQIITDKAEHSFLVTEDMPFAAVKETEKAETENTSVQTEEEAVTETYAENSSEESRVSIQKEKNDIKESSNNKIVVGVIIAILVILLALLLFLSKKRKEKTKAQPMNDESDDAEDDPTLLLKTEEDDDDDATIMMRQDEDVTFMPKTILIRSDDGDVIFNDRCITEITIGRKDICKVQIKGDKSVSGIHCAIYSDDQGNIWISDKNSSNGTFLNDEKLISDHMLEDGDSLEIGRSHYIVQIR